MFQVAQLILSVLLVPALAYIVSIEKRLTRLETKIEIICGGESSKDD